MKKAFAMQWHITDKCDQRCKHCYIYEGVDKNCKPELDLQSLLQILDNFIESCEKLDVVPVLYITGGDPLLSPNIWRLLEEIYKRNVKFSILGNPFHLNANVVKRLEELGCVYYQMSLDGLQKTHDYIRKEGSFESTIHALKLFENSKIKTVIMSTVSRTNFRELPDLVDVVVKNRVNDFSFARYCPNPNDYDLMLTPKEYREFLDEMYNKYNEHLDNSTTQLHFKDHLWTLYLYEIGKFDPKNIDNPNDLILDGCHCGINHITTLPDGTVYACRRSETPVGKVPEESFYDIFLGDNMNKYRQYKKFEKCSNCELLNFCRGCPSVANCLTGNFYSKDPQCWKEI